MFLEAESRESDGALEGDDIEKVEKLILQIEFLLHNLCYHRGIHKIPQPIQIYKFYYPCKNDS